MGYRIAFFTTDWNYEIGYSSLLGVRHFLDDYPDTSVCVFDCFGRYGRTNNDRGEFEIFRVPDLHDFDGCVIQSNQILPAAVREDLARRGREAGIPILSLNDEMEGCLFAGTDNYAAMRQIVEHLIYHHHLSRLSFVCGYPGSHESRERQRAFADVCREGGIPENNIHYFEGNWEYEQGAAAAASILRTAGLDPSSGSGSASRSADSAPALPADFPQVLVCANDDMALGACETFLKAGLRIPEDIIVTGFDNIGTAASFTPRLTTVSREYDEITRRGLTALREKIVAAAHSEDAPADTGAMDAGRKIFSISYPVFSESCGCGKPTPEENLRTRRRFFDMNRLMKNYYTRQSDMTAEMFDAETFTQIYRQFEKTAGMFGCPHVFLCVSSSEVEHHAEDSHHEELDEEMALVGIYSAENAKGFPVPFTCTDEHHVYTFFPRRQLLPAAIGVTSRLSIFYPLHYKEYCFGYIVLDGISPAAGINLVEPTFTFIDTAMENVRKKYLLRDLNRKLNGLYVTDSLTGLYNRFGFEENARKLFGMISDAGETPEILFLDMDNMKHINDTLGHKTGDRAIRAVADILKKVFGDIDRTFLMRYGGDEFVVICPEKCSDASLSSSSSLPSAEGLTEESSAARTGPRADTPEKKAILAVTEEYNRTSGAPYVISLSIGTVLAEKNDHQSLDALIQEADRRMYEEKQRRKAGRQ